jgi:hypothetical protein
MWFIKRFLHKKNDVEVKDESIEDSVVFVLEFLDNYMVDFVQSQIEENNKESNNIKIHTTISALFSSWYFTKNVNKATRKGNVIKLPDKVKNTIDQVFAAKSSFLLDHYCEKEPCLLDKNERQSFLEQTYDIQRDKLIKYQEIIYSMTETEDRLTYGDNLTKAVAFDLFGERFIDPLLKMIIITVLNTQYP